MRCFLLSAVSALALLASPLLAQTSPPPAPMPAPAAPASPPATTPAPAPAPPPAQAERPAEQDDPRFAENQIADRIDARVAQVKASLRLSEEQDRHWEAFREAARNFGVADARRHFAWSEQMEWDRRDRRGRDDAARDERPDEIAMMRLEAEQMAARADDFRKLTDAVEPLYRSLDDRQQSRLLRFVERFVAMR